MTELLSALSDWWLAAAVRGTRVGYAFTNAGHIVALALLVGAITTLDLRLLGLFRSIPLAHLAIPLVRVAAVGLGLAVLTGFLLFSARPDHYIVNTAFQVKLVFLLIGVANVLVVRALPAWPRALQGEPVTVTLRAAAAVSLTAWLATLLAGRWIAFV